MSSTPRAGASTPRRTTAYSLLGVPTSATDEQVRDAYKKAVIHAHPDKPGGTPVKFQAVQQAYQAIATAEKRRRYNASLREETKAKNFASVRPKPLGDVKKGLSFRLLDGSMYEFETAPDKMKSKYRHGDVVQGPKGDQGVIIGLASDGVYWVKNNEPCATLLFSPDFGGDRDIHVLFRDKRSHGLNAAVSRDAKIKKEMTERANQRKLEHAIRTLTDQETARREEIVSAVDLYFNDCKRSLKEWLEKQAAQEVPKLARPVPLIWRRRPDSAPLTDGEGVPLSRSCLPPDLICFESKRLASTATLARSIMKRLEEPNQASPSRSRPMAVPPSRKSVEPTEEESAANAENTDPRAAPIKSGASTPRAGSRSLGSATEQRAAARARSSSASATTRATLTDRRSDLQRMLNEAKALRHQVNTKASG